MIKRRNLVKAFRVRARRLNAWFRHSFRQRITLAGAVFTLFTVAAGIIAFRTNQNLLFLLVAGMLSTMLISGFVSRLGLSALELELLLPEHILARQRVEARFRLRNRKLFMPSFALRLSGMEGTELQCELYYPVIGAGGTEEQSIWIQFPHRGKLTSSTFILSSRFPFGFTERRVRVALKQEILIYPSLQPQPALVDLLRRLQGEGRMLEMSDGLEFHRLRGYEPHDSIRHIDWKATARTGEVHVREFARERNPEAAVFLDLRLTDMRLSRLFELAVESSAFLAYHLWLENGRVRFRTQNFDRQVPDQTDIYTILKYLAVAGPHSTAPLPAPNVTSALEMVVTTAPERFTSDVWSHAALVGPGLLSALEPDAEPESTARKDVNYGGGAGDGRITGEHHGSASATDRRTPWN